MISTVTISAISSVVTTVTSVTSVASLGIGTAIGIAAAVTLLCFLTTKEIVSVRVDDRSQRMSRFLNAGIVPLLAVFAATVIAAVMTLL